MNKLKLADLNTIPEFRLDCPAADMEREISSIYCCDLLSRVMGNAPADGAWVTVMANMNAVAVALLADISAIILAEGMELDDAAYEKAKEQNICVFCTDLSIFSAALRIHELALSRAEG